MTLSIDAPSPPPCHTPRIAPDLEEVITLPEDDPCKLGFDLLSNEWSTAHSITAMYRRANGNDKIKDKLKHLWRHLFEHGDSDGALGLALSTGVFFMTKNPALAKKAVSDAARRRSLSRKAVKEKKTALAEVDLCLGSIIRGDERFAGWGVADLANYILKKHTIVNRDTLTDDIRERFIRQQVPDTKGRATHCPRHCPTRCKRRGGCDHYKRPETA
jgi:hypothetical protein